MGVDFVRISYVRLCICMWWRLFFMWVGRAHPHKCAVCGVCTSVCLCVDPCVIPVQIRNFSVVRTLEQFLNKE